LLFIKRSADKTISKNWHILYFCLIDFDLIFLFSLLTLNNSWNVYDYFKTYYYLNWIFVISSQLLDKGTLRHQQKRTQAKKHDATTNVFQLLNLARPISFINQEPWSANLTFTNSNRSTRQLRRCIIAWQTFSGYSLAWIWSF